MQKVKPSKEEPTITVNNLFTLLGYMVIKVPSLVVHSGISLIFIKFVYLVPLELVFRPYECHDTAKLSTCKVGVLSHCVYYLCTICRLWCQCVDCEIEWNIITGIQLES